ncbi:MAG: chromosome partitioning protein ParA [Peptococcaceae bacterium]|nr:chromosome partitioning protein ParA [Peptococcaceae bacterium]
MRIRLAILESDMNYLSRITALFTEKFADKLEVHSFSDEKLALNDLAGANIDVFVAGSVFNIETSELPPRCGFAYLVDSPRIDTYREQRAINRFQKADLIYKEILRIYSDVADVSAIGFKLESGETSTRVIAFVSACGGVGSSSMAAACAVSLTKRGLPVVYLNCEQFGSSNIFFSDQGNRNFSDVIYSLKSKKSNLLLKLESTVKQDEETGVHYYDQANLALDVMEMREEDYEQLFSGLSAMNYSHIILDMDFSLNAECLDVLRMAQTLVFVSDGSEMSNVKFARALASLMILDQQNGTDLCHRITLLYNRFSSKTSKRLDNGHLVVLGGAPKYERATTRRIVEQLAGMPLFEELI